MPGPAGLRVHHHDGTTFVTAGQMMVACYSGGDIAMRNVAVAVARQLGFSGQRVAEVRGLPPSYVATLHRRARRTGGAGLVRRSGPKPKRSPADWAQAARWRQAGASEARIAARLGVAQATVSRHLAGAGQQQLPFGGGPAGAPDAAGGGPEPQPEPGREEPAACPQRAAEPEPAAAAEPEPATSPPACWPAARAPPVCTTSMTISCPMPGPRRPARAGTISAARPGKAGRTPTSHKPATKAPN